MILAGFHSLTGNKKSCGKNAYEQNSMFFKWAEPTNRPNFAILPYIKGITEPLTRIPNDYDMQVTNKPIKTLKQSFPVPKFRPAEDDRCYVMYKIPCTSCP